MNTYDGIAPAGVVKEDIEWAIVQAVTTLPLGVMYDLPNVKVIYAVALSPSEVTALQAAIGNAFADPAAPWRLHNQLQDRTVQAVTTLRAWAVDARNTTVTQGNAVAVLQVVVNRLGVLADRLADLIELT